MPFTLIATMSSGWTKRFIASEAVDAPVSSVRARSTMTRAASAFGQSWFGCIKEGKSVPLVTFTTFPGTDSGVNPCGGLAVNFGSGAAQARRVLSAAAPAALIATAAEVRTNARREIWLGIAAKASHGSPDRAIREGSGDPPWPSWASPTLIRLDHRK